MKKRAKRQGSDRKTKTKRKWSIGKKEGKIKNSHAQSDCEKSGTVEYS